MAHPEQRNFVQKIKNKYPVFFVNKKVLDVGSYNFNGSLRDFFDNCDYTGIDIEEGPCVDIVCEGQNYDAPNETYDVVCSAECFEHNPYWLETFKNMIRLCKKNGFVFFTCATTGRAEHGTNKSSPESSQFTVNKGWGDYYKNLTEKDFTDSMDVSKYFKTYGFEVNPHSFDLYFWGIKTTENIDLDKSSSSMEVFEQSFKDSNNYEVLLKIEKKENAKSPYITAVEESLLNALSKKTVLPDWILSMEGMSGKRYRMFVNSLFSLLPSSKYLEIGCWKGSTACSALYGNNVKAMLIDNWSEFGGPKETFYSNLQRCLSEKNTDSFAECIDEDFRTVKYDLEKKYDIYLYDGPHTEKDHIESLIKPYASLNEEFIFICDDWNWDVVRNNTKKSIANLNLEIIYFVEIFSKGKEDGNEGHMSDWHNGYFIAVCRKSNQTIKKPIPVMGVPIVNGLHWLKRLIESIDYPVNELFIVNNNGKGEITEELDKIVETSHKHINAIKVTHLPYNLGCSGAWNLIIKCYMNSPYWLIVNNDVAFTPGLLEKMNDAALNTDAEMIHGKVSQWGSVTGGAYDLFLIKDSAVQKCGLFDENLYPIYAEDVDYSIRATNENIKTLNLNIEYLHGDKDYESSGSQTWRLDPENLKEKMNTSRILNETDYLYKKWGNDFYATGFYQTPFNNQNYDSKYTTYDLNFVRKKYLGF